MYTNSVTLYNYDAADVMDDDNYATVLDSYITTSSLQVAKVHTKKVPGLEHSLFMESLYQAIGPCAILVHLVNLSLDDTLLYDPYEDKMQNAKRWPMLDEEPEVTPE